MINKKSMISSTSASKSQNHQDPNRRESDAYSLSHKSSNAFFGFIDTQQISILAHFGEIEKLFLIEPKEYVNEGIIVSVGNSRGDNQLKFWDVSSMSLLFEQKKQGYGKILVMGFCKISNTFVTSSSDKTIGEYLFDPMTRTMSMRHQFRLKMESSHLVIFKDKLFLASKSEKFVAYYSLSNQKIIHIIQIDSIPNSFCYIPEINSIGINHSICSLVRVSDSAVQDVYFEAVGSNNKRQRNNQDTTRNLIVSSQNESEETQPLFYSYQDNQLKRSISSELIRHGIGRDGLIQICQMAQYQKSLDSVLFIFIDFIIFYSISAKSILFIIKDIPPIENVQFSYAYDLILLQCSDCTETSYFLTLQRVDPIPPSNFASFQIPDSQKKPDLKFQKLSCQKFAKSRSFFISDGFLVMDNIQISSKNQILRRKILLNPKKSPSSSKKLSLMSAFSKSTSKMVKNQREVLDQNGLDIVEEENHASLIQIPNLANDKNVDILNQKNALTNQEKLCRCIIF